jgi:hypothetical protein
LSSSRETSATLERCTQWLSQQVINMKENVMDLLTKNGFSKPKYVKNMPSIANYFKPNKRCGIYVLHFENNEYYVGQAIDLTRRYVQHFKNHNDIIEISLKIISKNKLNEEERKTIKLFEEKNYFLRNITFSSIPKGESDLEMIVPNNLQEQWLNLGIQNSVNVNRLDNFNLRKKYEKKYLQLAKNYLFNNEILVVLKKYFQNCIIEPRFTEMTFWSISCLPSYHSNEVIIYSRVNIYWQEVLTIGKLLKENKVFYSFHLAKGPFEKLTDKEIKNHYSSIFKYEDTFYSEHYYPKGGSDQFNFEVHNYNEVLQILSDDTFLYSIKLFNLRLMNMGPCIFDRYHCFYLADKILE